MTDEKTKNDHKPEEKKKKAHQVRGKRACTGESKFHHEAKPCIFCAAVVLKLEKQIAYQRYRQLTTGGRGKEAEEALWRFASQLGIRQKPDIKRINAVYHQLAALYTEETQIEEMYGKIPDGDGEDIDLEDLLKTYVAEGES